MRHYKGLSLAVLTCLFTSAAIAGGLPTDDKKTDAAAPAKQESTVTQTASATTSNTALADDETSSQPANNAAANDGGAAATGFVAVEDDPLVVDVSAIMDDDGMGNIQVQWQISDNGASWRNLPGVIQQSFTPREQHVGSQLRVQISYVDGQGNLETIISPASQPVQNVNDRPSGAPILTGMRVKMMPDCRRYKPRRR